MLCAMRPMIKSGLRRLRRDDRMVQLGLDPSRAVVLTEPDHMRVIEVLDGTRRKEEVSAAAGVPEPVAGGLLDVLFDRGVLDDASESADCLRKLDVSERDRLRPDLASMSLVRGRAGSGVSALARRRASVVHIRGGGRVGATTACLLGAAGVGYVRIIDRESSRSADVSPGGISPEDVGASREIAGAAALRRLTRGVRTGSKAPPHLVILAPADSPGLPDALDRYPVPHLFAGVRETTGIVGPLVVPGSTCLRCQHLTRRDRDPAWPRLAAQLSRPAPGVPPCDTVLATAVAAQAAFQALAYLDRYPERPATLGGTLEMNLPDWRWRRRSWPPHPLCGCCLRRSDGDP